MKLRVFVIGMSFLLSCVVARAADRKYIKPPESSKGLPFSDAVQVGDTLYVAGHIGLDPNGSRQVNCGAGWLHHGRLDFGTDLLH
jgi:enamine deaminase RidA (YjgF/YER057c/UK114 family)